MNDLPSIEEMNKTESEAGCILALSLDKQEELKKYKEKRMAEIEKLRRQKELATVKVYLVTRYSPLCFDDKRSKLRTHRHIVQLFF